MAFASLGASGTKSKLKKKSKKKEIYQTLISPGGFD
jgi:hypothetical protein